MDAVAGELGRKLREGGNCSRRLTVFTAIVLAAGSLGAGCGSATGSNSSAKAPTIVMTPAVSHRIAYLQWQPDGFSNMYSMRQDGTNPRPLLPSSVHASGPTWSWDGARIAYISDETGSGQIWVTNADGTARRQLTHSSSQAAAPTWSPTGGTLAYMNLDSQTSMSIWTIHQDGSDATKIADGAAYPAWSPDGTTIAYVKVDSDGSHIWLMNPSGGDQRELVNSVPDSNFSTCAQCRSQATDSGVYYISGLAWSPDGRQLLFATNVSLLHVANDLWSADPHGGKIQRLTKDALAYPRSDDEDPTWSPDGKQIAYSHWIQARQRYEIWIMNADGTDQHQLYKHPADNVGVPAWQPSA